MVHDARVAALCITHGVTEFWAADRDQLAGVDEPGLALADHHHSGALATLEARLKFLGAA